MKKFISKFSAILSAAAVTAVSMPFAASVVTAADTTSFPYTIEGENMEGADLWTSIYNDQIPGYSGEGFVYLTSKELSFNVTVPEDGMYQVSARVAQILDKTQRQQTMVVNGAKYIKQLPYHDTWTDFDFGIVRLNKGENTISFISEYGYMAIDTVTVSVAEKKNYSVATDQLCDPKATPETKALMSYLKSVYGKHTISGQQEIYGGGHKNNYEWENEFLYDLSGKYPAIRGLDLMNYNPLYGWDDGSTERAIEWVKEKNGIITASWHINVPIDFENYTVGDEVDWQKCTYKNYQASNSTFNTAKVLEADSKERAYFEAAMEDLAEQLLKMQEANVPIIFRPLHEAQGNEGNYPDGTSWFWWGDRGAEVYKELWKLLYTTLTEEYGLHNIIWEYNSYDYANSHTWYPGDEYVDIVAYDKYNVEYNRGDGKSSGPNLLAIPAKFDYLYKLTDGKKMVAMSENDTVPAMDNMIVEDANWLYFCPWYDGGEDGGTAFLGENYQDHEELKKMYQSEYCITLDELPEDLYVYKGSSELPVTTTAVTTGKPDVNTTVTTAEAGDVLYGDANHDGVVSIADATAILQAIGNPDKYALDEQGIKNSDIDGEAGLTGNDALVVQLLEIGVYKQSDLPLKKS